jgi:hypothetical protein
LAELIAEPIFVRSAAAADISSDPAITNDIPPTSHTREKSLFSTLVAAKIDDQ